MTRRLIPILLLLLFSSHDMFLKLDTYFLEPNKDAVIKLYNGTFDRSENAIDRDRMQDVSLVGNGNRITVNQARWSERDEMTLLSFKTGMPGTWVAGVSTRPRNIELAAADFNSYLEHDGLLDMLQWRQENNEMGTDAVEKYSKHVKVLFQVGNEFSGDWRTRLDYPLEFMPLENPYYLHPGHNMKVRLLWKGKPLANQLVYAGYRKNGQTAGTAPDSSPSEEASYRTDAEGNVSLYLSAEGVWYLRTIYLTHSRESGLTHESNWATLTFAVGKGHGDSHQ